MLNVNQLKIYLVLFTMFINKHILTSRTYKPTVFVVCELKKNSTCFSKKAIL